MSVTYDVIDRARFTEVGRVFYESFAASEGAAEGAMIKELAQTLLQTVDVFGCMASQDESIAAAILWSPMTYDGAQAWLLSPVATRPEAQGRGIGQGLIRFGLDILQERGVGAALTYGDPAFYGKLGFAPIREAQIAAPYPLSMPMGWLGQELIQGAFEGLRGTPTPVPPFQNPAIW